MQKSSRFPAAVHILTILAAVEGRYVSSEILAKSLDTNRVVVRRLLSLLANAGLVSTQAGVRGGTRIERKPADISLLDVFQAVEEGPLFRFHTPQAQCPVATVVTEDLTTALNTTEASLHATLAGISLEKVGARGIQATRDVIRNGIPT